MRIGIEFQVPDELIAQSPVSPRNAAKLLVYNRETKQIVDDYFYNLSQYLLPNTTIVTNNTKVEPCRLLFGGKEIFILERHGTNTVLAMVRPGKAFKVGAVVQLTNGLSATVTGVNEYGHRTLSFNVPHDSELLKKYEHVPLPPYIAQNDKLADEYQTVFAKGIGSKAAPTAGLHFTKDQLEELQKEHPYAEVDLQVGLGTFASITEENFKTGTLHTERYSVDAQNTAIIKKAAHITAVGTTSLRTIESINWAADERSYSSATNIFINPGYTFKKADSLITNFHLPGTSLLLLVEAFIGSQTEMQRVYDHALRHSYRFYSFGDAMLII